MPKIRRKLISSTIVRGGTRSDPIPLTGLDIFNGNIGIPVVLVYPGGLDAEKLKASLARTLAHYPMMTGQIRKGSGGYHFIDCNDGGATFKIFRCDGALPKYGPDLPLGDDLKQFYTPRFPWNTVDSKRPPFSFEIYQFADGGALLSVTGPHSITDGSSFWQFMSHWTRIHRGESINTPPPGRDNLLKTGEQYLEHAHEYKLVYDPGWGERLRLYIRLAGQMLGGMKSEVFRIPVACLRQWSAEAEGGDAASAPNLIGLYCLKVLSPHFRSAAERRIGIVFDLRHKRQLGIPADYVGNALGYGEALYSAEELATQPLALLARKCKPSRHDISAERLRALLGLMESYRRRKAVWKLMLKPVADGLDTGILLNNCTLLPVYDADFGTGRPSWHDIFGVMFRMVLLHTTPENDGSIDIHLSAPRREIEAFRRAHAALLAAA